MKEESTLQDLKKTKAQQFLEFARVLPEPLILVTDKAEILATNGQISNILGYSDRELRGKMLFHFVREAFDKVIKYIQVCSRSKRMTSSSLTFCTNDDRTIVCGCEGAVIQPWSPNCEALIILRLNAPEITNSSVIQLNQKISELSKEIQEHRQIEAELTKANAELEMRLREQMAALNKISEELQDTQAHLIQTERTSSLGQLVGGVAHEINNPINFIYGNIAHANRYMENLLKLVQVYALHYPQPVPEVQALSQEIDLKFVAEDLPKLLRSMKVGAERIQGIVTSLKNFSRIDEAEIKIVDIHEGIDSTLTILQNRLEGKHNSPAIAVVKEYGNLPKVECSPGQLNQVFMNIIENAIEAIAIMAKKAETTENIWRIRIATEILGKDWVAIKIADNGCGISPRAQLRLFDPFFTTKPIDSLSAELM